MRDRVRLISLYKANDTSYRAGAVIILLNISIVLLSPSLLFWLEAGATYFARETESTAAMRVPLFTAKLDISVGREYIAERGLENADIWRAIKAGQG